MSALTDLLAPFTALPGIPDAGPERPFAFEPFTMPVRAFAATLEGYAAEAADLEVMDMPPTPPELLEDGYPLPTSAIDTLPLAEAGANATTQLAALWQGLAMLDVSSAVPALYWRCGLTADVWEDMALLRAGKALAHRLFAQKGIDTFVLKVCAAGRRADMTAADGYTNLLRLATHALTAHAAGADYLYLPPFAAQAPGLEALRERIHQVIEEESRVHSYGPAQKGAYWPTLLAAQMMRAAINMAGSTQDLKAAAAETLAAKKAAIAAGTRVWVGQTKFSNEALTIPGPHSESNTEWQS